MIYIVTGLDRTGTSYMTRAIATAGNYNVVYDKGVDDFLNKKAVPGSNPNPHGYYTVDHNKIKNWGEMDGKLIKLPLHIVAHREFNNPKIVLMTRNEEEQKISLNKTFPYVSDHKHHLDAVINLYNPCVINFNNLFINPKKELLRLVAYGWEVNIDKMVELIDPKLYRVRL